MNQNSSSPSHRKAAHQVLVESEQLVKYLPERSIQQSPDTAPHMRKLPADNTPDLLEGDARVLGKGIGSHSRVPYRHMTDGPAADGQSA